MLYRPCRLERNDLQAQGESLRTQTLATLSERDQQIRQLGAMLEEARSSEPKLLQEHTHRQVWGTHPELLASHLLKISISIILHIISLN